MKRWTWKEIDNLARELLNPEEQKNFGDPPRSTISEYRKSSHWNDELFARITRCSCVDSLKENTDIVVDLRREVEGENRENILSPEELKAQQTPRSISYLRKIKKHIARLNKEKKCHLGLWRYLFICYCDEHNH